MKSLLLLAFALLNGTFSLMAQTNDKELKQLANEICTCFSKHNPVHDKEFDKVVQKVYNMSPPDAEKHIETLPEDQRMRFAQNMDKIDKLERTNPAFNQCSKSWEDKAEIYLAKKGEAGISEETVLAALSKEFKKKKKCRILGLLLLN